MRKTFALLAVIFIVLAGSGLAGAQPPVPEIEGGEIVARNFNGPQGVIRDPEGNLWVIDSGVAGEETIPYVEVQTGELFETTMGPTARIVKVTPAGEQEVITQLPSLTAAENEMLGGARLALLEGTLYATVGGWIGGVGREPPEFMGTVVKVNDEVTEVADLWALEKAENPDGFILESHPYGLSVGPEGWLWVADAAANDVVRVDPASGEIEVVAVFTEGLPGGFPNPNRDGAVEADPVPTAVVPTGDGSAYVSFLSGAPFTPGTAKVVLVSSEGEVSDFATGLTTLTDLQLGPDGQFYAVQFAIWGEQGPTPNSGAIVRVKPGADSEMVWPELPFPTSIAFDDEGNAYVTVNGVGAPGSGAVARLPALTERKGQPLSDMSGMDG